MQYAITALLFALSCLAYGGSQSTSSYESVTTSDFVTKTNILTVDQLDATGHLHLELGDDYHETYTLDNTVTTRQKGTEYGSSTTYAEGYTHGNIGHFESETTGESNGNARVTTTLDNRRTGEYYSEHSGSEYGTESGEFDVVTTGTVTTRTNFETEFESEVYSEYTTY